MTGRTAGQLGVNYPWTLGKGVYCSYTPDVDLAPLRHAADAFLRSEERRVGKSVSVRVDLGGRRIITQKQDMIICSDSYQNHQHDTDESSINQTTEKKTT